MKSHRLKKTTLLLSIQVAVISSTTSYALTSRNTQQTTINQLVVNDQSLRRQQNQMVTELNNLQKYTRAQNKNYDDAIENLIKQNNELIELNQSMLSQLEKLDKQVDVLTSNTATNKKNTLSLTQATTKKVKEIQSLLDEQDKQYDDLSNKGKALLIGLCILSLLLGALLWSMLRKLNKQTLKLKNEIERVLNQMQANTDSSIAELKQQQTETLHQWKKDIDQDITTTINQTIQDSTNKHLAEIKQKTNALMTNEKSEALQKLQTRVNQVETHQSELAQSIQQVKQSAKNLPSSVTTPVQTNPNKAKSESNSGVQVSTKEYKQSLSCATANEIESTNDKNIINEVTNTPSINQVAKPSDIEANNRAQKETPNIPSTDSDFDDEISPEDILAALDSETAELAANQYTNPLHFDEVTNELIDELDDDEIDLDDLDSVTHTDLPKAASKEDISAQNIKTNAETKAIDTKLSNTAFNRTITENTSDKASVNIATENTVANTEKAVSRFIAKPAVTEVAATKSSITKIQSDDKTDINHDVKNEVIETTVLEEESYTEEAEEIEVIDPTELFNTAVASESKGNMTDALTGYNQLITTFESDNDDNTTKLVGLALDKKAKLLLSNNRVKDAIDAYDQIISSYDSSNEDYAKNIVSNAILNSALLELTTTGSINGSKIGTARAVFKDSPENMLAMEAFETLRLSARRDVTSTQNDLLQKYADVKLINIDWQALDSWTENLNHKTKPRVQESVTFFKNWNDQPSIYS